MWPCAALPGFMYILAHTHTRTHTGQSTHRRKGGGEGGEMTDSEGSRVANVLLMLLGRNDKRKL